MIKRYEIDFKNGIISPNGFYPPTLFIESECGSFVMYKDHIEEINALKHELYKITGDFQKLKLHFVNIASEILNPVDVVIKKNESTKFYFGVKFKCHCNSCGGIAVRSCSGIYINNEETHCLSCGIIGRVKILKTITNDNNEPHFDAFFVSNNTISEEKNDNHKTSNK